MKDTTSQGPDIMQLWELVLVFRVRVRGECQGQLLHIHTCISPTSLPLRTSCTSLFHQYDLLTNWQIGL